MSARGPLLFQTQPVPPLSWHPLVAYRSRPFYALAVPVPRFPSGTGVSHRTEEHEIGLEPRWVAPIGVACSALG